MTNPSIDGSAGPYLSTSTQVTGDTLPGTANPGARTPSNVAAADLQVRADNTVIKATPGSQVSFGFTVSNTGDVTATNVITTDTLPAGLMNAQAFAALGTPALQDGAFTDSIPSLPAGASFTVTFTATYARSGVLFDALHASSDEAPTSLPDEGSVLIAANVPTTTSVSCYPPASFVSVGQPVTFPVDVSYARGFPLAGAEAPSGPVTLSIDGVPYATTQAFSGFGTPEVALAVFEIPGLSAGIHRISASYAGSTNADPSRTTQDFVLDVSPTPVNPTTISLTATQQSFAFGEPVTVIPVLFGPAGRNEEQSFSFGEPVSVTASVTGLASPSFYGDAQPVLHPPVGSITFLVDGQRVGSPVPLQGWAGSLTSTASIVLPMLSAGTHRITAQYSGDLYPRSDAPELAITTNPALTDIVVSATPSPSASGQSVTFDASVSSVVQTLATATTPGGFVDFRQGTTLLDRVPVDSNGHARFTTSALTVGAHDIIAYYEGDPNHAASASNGITQMVLGSPGPTVQSIRPYGPTVPSALVIEFSRPLDAARAHNPSNYRIIGAGGRAIAVDAVSYAPSSDAVTLFLSQNVNPRGHYRITVVGTGPGAITDVYGNPLDGAGHNGTDYVTSLTRRNPVFDRHARAGPRQAARLRR